MKKSPKACASGDFFINITTNLRIFVQELFTDAKPAYKLIITIFPDSLSSKP